MNNSIVNIGGEELELRTISARQFLSSRMEAELMSEALGEDMLGKAVLLGASLLAKGLFFDGQRVFKSMEEVLDALSADEIILNAGYIDVDPEMKTKIMEDMKRIQNANDEFETFAAEDNFDSGDSYSYKMQKANENPGAVSAYQNETIKSSGFYHDAGFSPRNEMRQVSDFFQRDSRRYDGNISGF